MHSMAMAMGRSAMVVKELAINEQSLDAPQVHIKARKAGLLSFLLALIGIDPTVTFDVYFNRIEYREGSLSGELCWTYPLSAVSAAITGFARPIILFVLGVLFALGGLIMFVVSAMGGYVSFAPVVGIVLGGIFLLFYFLRKTMMMGVVTHGGPYSFLVVKSSVIEGQTVDYQLAQRVIAIINRNVMSQTTR